MSNSKMNTGVAALLAAPLVLVIGIAPVNATADDSKPLSQGTILKLSPEMEDEAKSSSALRDAIRRVQMEILPTATSTLDVAKALVHSGVDEEFPEIGVSGQLGQEDAQAQFPSNGRALPPLDTVIGLCIRLPIGPGRVEWGFSNPSGSTAYFSVKPENSNSLVWAKAPGQDVDGVYRRSWGKCKALKIPDSATVNIDSANGTIRYCQNAAAALLGHVVKWTNTCSGDEASWPDSPR
ncbi:MAG: hypothetical protein LBR21_11290 [Propionibacteriaceae bacterium]|jgi:hypothetical protein|nr:hypothetical protein [Propionibacteriaceae bacterium]